MTQSTALEPDGASGVLAHRAQALTTARALATRFSARAQAADRLGALPAEDVRDLKVSGYLGLSVPVAFGGSGLGLGDCVAAQLELARGSTSTALVAAMQVHLFGHAEETRPWPESVHKQLGRLAASGALMNSVASEPELGSPSRGGLPKTEVRRAPTGTGWLVSGRKSWTTGGAALDYLLVRCRLGDEAVVVLVPGDATGVEWQPTWRDALSLRASDSHELVLHDVAVPEDAIIARGAPASPLPNAWFALLTAATYLGAGLAARDRLILYAQQRIPTALGRPIATLPGIQRQMGEMQAVLQSAELFLQTAADEWSAEPLARRDARYPRVVAAKHVAIEAALRATELALRVAGGASLSSDLEFERYFRDARAGLMHPPTGDAALELIGRALLGGVEPT
ncbi:MAG: acyl-CoA/acyl-ACP dehydrogenase [Anaerolineales bacterium]|nr:acyl-CoA/acyl-ACP dehydrogenase [Anaerolineales bacterium]